MHTIGIDFGTTKTLVSHINPRTGQPEPLRLGRGTHLLPTTIYIDKNGHYFFGDDADDMIEEATGCYIRGFKMKLGSESPMHLLPDGSLIFARDLVREYLQFICKKVEELVYHGEQITKATITRPVKFSPAQCMELEQAAKAAGFQQVEFTTEPEAAGLAYCHLNASHAFARNALVVDWGGGTLDFALVTRHEGTVRTHANLTDGDTSMGGEKFDNLLWNHVEQAAMQLEVDYLDYVTQMPLIRRAKEVLSSHQTFTLRLSSAAGACPPIPLSRSEFNKLIEADVTKAAEKVQALIQRIPVDLKPEMLLLVGGSSQIPLIKEQLEAVCHLPAMRWQYSREAVALGAALTSYIQVDAQTLFDRAEQYCEQNRIEEAASLYHRAAEAGCADAQFFLALCYTIDKNLINALSRLQEAEEAQGEDGVLEVSDRWNENANQAEAVKWFRAAAEQEHADAQYDLGSCYLNGTGVAQNPAEAVKWLYAAAEQEHADAQYDLGLCYLNGSGVTQNPAEAVKWFRAAAEQEHADAQYDLGLCYLNGSGVAQNPAEAVKWFRSAAEQGHARAQYALSDCYFGGIGVEQNMFEAAKWIRQAAEQEHAEAQYLLGCCYLKGIGVPADQTEAVKWISAAAEQGLEEARDFFHSNEQNFACSICGNNISMQENGVMCPACSAEYALTEDGYIQLLGSHVTCTCGAVILFHDRQPVQCSNCGQVVHWAQEHQQWRVCEPQVSSQLQENNSSAADNVLITNFITDFKYLFKYLFYSAVSTLIVVLTTIFLIPSESGALVVIYWVFAFGLCYRLFDIKTKAFWKTIMLAFLPPSALSLIFGFTTVVIITGFLWALILPIVACCKQTK